MRVGLAVVAGVEEPHPGGELGWDVEDVLAGLRESLRPRPPMVRCGHALA